MKNIIELLVTSKITKEDNTVGVTVVANDTRLISLTSKVRKSMMYVEEVETDDVLQITLECIMKYTKSFTEKYNYTTEQIYTALQVEGANELAKNYWGYINASTLGYIKDLKKAKLKGESSTDYMYKENIITFSQLAQWDGGEESAIDTIMEKQQRLSEEDTEISYNHFNVYSRENAKKLLTAKQYKYFIGDAETLAKDKDTKRMKQSIAKRLLAAYSKNYDIESKVSERADRIAVINSIVKTNDLETITVIIRRCESTISDIIYCNDLDTETAKYYTSLIKGQATYNKAKMDKIKVLLIRYRNKITKNL